MSTTLNKLLPDLQKNSDFGYVQLDVDEKSRQLLHQAVSRSVDPKLYYNSKTISYIRGDVTPQAHITVCYGIKNTDLHDRLVKSKIVIKKLSSQTISKIEYWPGFQNDYGIIVAIPKKSEELYKLDQWIRNNNDISDLSLPIKPHISLCYIKKISNKSIDHMVFKLSKSLVGEKITFSELNFFKPITEEKTNLIIKPILKNTEI